MKKFVKTIIYSIALILPAVSSAQGLFSGDFNGVLAWILPTLNNVVMPIIITLMVVMLLYGIFKFMFQKGDEKAREEGKQLMLWGIIGLTVALTIFGFVGFLKRSLFGPGPVDPQSSGGITPCVYDTNGPNIPGC